ncbi:hypothetical protein GB937_006627 [Aspergillus fischeri]|nr:hypothetical protein GB937_006627 [Aspergillus fischeri]
MEMKQEGKGKKVKRREKHGEGKRGWMEENGQEEEIEMFCYAVAWTGDRTVSPKLKWLTTAGLELVPLGTR